MRLMVVNSTTRTPR